MLMGISARSTSAAIPSLFTHRPITYTDNVTARQGFVKASWPICGSIAYSGQVACDEYASVVRLKLGEIMCPYSVGGEVYVV